MRISSDFIPLALVLTSCTIAGTGAAQSPSIRYYIPFVSASAAVSGPHGTVSWQSDFQVVNASSSVQPFLFAETYGDVAAISPFCPIGVQHLQPGDREWMSICYMAQNGSASLGLTVVETVPEVLIHATVSRVEGGCNQGRAELPVFAGIYPAGATAAAGEVTLGNPYLGSSYYPLCSTQKYLRRMNVTLFNAGSADATFTVTVRPIGAWTTVLTTVSPVVPAKSLRQINGVAVPLPPSPDPVFMANNDVQVWVTVTADQPFLAYVSTIFDDPQPGALPFQVYPARLTN